MYIINYIHIHYNSTYTYIGTGTFVTGALVPVFVEFVAQHQYQFYLHWYIMYLAIPMYNYKTNYGDLYVYEFLHEMNVFLSFYLNIFGTAYIPSVFMKYV